MKSSIANGENRGSVINLLLKALQSGDKYGYEINKEIETKSKRKYFLKEASLYSGLKRLEASGDITSYWKDGELGMKRHYYSITEKGLNRLSNSNFTWDSSKDFLDDIFTAPIKNKIEENTEIVNNLIVENKEEIIETKKEQPEIKKNPFQIEVSPLQQSFFDNIDVLNSSYKQKEELLNEQKETSDKQTENTVNNIEKVEENTPKEKIEATIKNDLIVEAEKVIEKENNVASKKESYEDLILKFNKTEDESFSKSLEKEQKLDLTSLINIKENESSIISTPQNIENDLQTVENKNSDNIILNNENININTFNEKLNLNTTQTTIEKDETNLNNNEITKNNEVNIKNIFGNLLADNNKEEEKVEETVIKEPKIIAEMPRNHFENNVNITLSPVRNKEVKENNYSYNYKNSINEFKSSNDIVNKSGANTIPSVKQYITNVHKQNLSKSTNIKEEINFDGISVREYQKINNKVIKNSNYIYTNKVNLFIFLALSLFVVFETIFSFVLLSKNNILSAFEIVFNIVSLIFILVILYFKVKEFVNDKYKVEFKNYNFKSSLFYMFLIFIVLSVLLVCINIFMGMNSLNIKDFILKLMFEILICFNIVLFPIIKNWFYKLKSFSN